MNYSPLIQISHNRIEVNGQTRFEAAEDMGAVEFLSAAYEGLGIDYRRFYKMDPLSKLGFIASELALAGVDRDEPKEDMAVAFFNSSASLAADLTYHATIRDRDAFFPSPADFVYTLPNIVLGEIAIRNRIHGETAFYIARDFRPDDLAAAARHLSAAGMKRILAAWVETDRYANRAECYMALFQ